MKKKATGFTIIELMITLALTTLTLGVIYTFFFSSNKTISTTELGLQLQTEGESIQKELVERGTQSKEIFKINGTPSEDIKYSSLGTDGKLEITSLEIETYDDIAHVNTIWRIILDNNKLKIQDKLGNDIKILSDNVKSFKIRPLDIHMVKDKTIANLKNAPGLEFTVDLGIKKGYSDVEYTSRGIVKFRNK